MFKKNILSQLENLQAAIYFQIQTLDKKEGNEKLSKEENYEKSRLSIWLTQLDDLEFEIAHE